MKAQLFICDLIYCLVKVDCGIPPDGENTTEVNVGPSLALEKYTYSCLTGYSSTDDMSIVCLPDGSWLGSPPTCTG